MAIECSFSNHNCYGQGVPYAEYTDFDQLLLSDQRLARSGLNQDDIPPIESHIKLSDLFRSDRNINPLIRLSIVGSVFAGLEALQQNREHQAIFQLLNELLTAGVIEARQINGITYLVPSGNTSALFDARNSAVDAEIRDNLLNTLLGNANQYGPLERAGGHQYRSAPYSVPYVNEQLRIPIEYQTAGAEHQQTAATGFTAGVTQSIQQNVSPILEARNFFADTTSGAWEPPATLAHASTIEQFAYYLDQKIGPNWDQIETEGLTALLGNLAAGFLTNNATTFRPPIIGMMIYAAKDVKAAWRGGEEYDPGSSKGALLQAWKDTLDGLVGNIVGGSAVDLPADANFMAKATQFVRQKFTEASVTGGVMEGLQVLIEQHTGRDIEMGKALQRVFAGVVMSVLLDGLFEAGTASLTAGKRYLNQFIDKLDEWRGLNSVSRSSSNNTSGVDVGTQTSGDSPVNNGSNTASNGNSQTGVHANNNSLHFSGSNKPENWFTDASTLTGSAEEMQALIARYSNIQEALADAGNIYDFATILRSWGPEGATRLGSGETNTAYRLVIDGEPSNIAIKIGKGTVG